MKKITVSLGGRSFVFSIGGLIVYLVVLTILCSLGRWQLNRAEQKTLYLQQLEVAGRAEAIDLNQIQHRKLQFLEYKTVSISGQYDEAHQILIDNQVKNGNPGYFIMTPFHLDGTNKSVLVNRGWLPMDRNRSNLPDVTIDKLSVIVKGRVNHFPSVGLKLEGADIPTSSWPAVVQVVNIGILSKRLGYSLLDFQVELDAAMADGYDRDWQSISIIPPEKHVAYAVQWFGLALTLTVLFIWFSLKK